MLSKLLWFWHPLEGAFTIVAGLVHPVYAVMWFIAWMVYELDEDWHISDSAYKDIEDFMIGFAFAILTTLALRYF